MNNWRLLQEHRRVSNIPNGPENIPLNRRIRPSIGLVLVTYGVLLAIKIAPVPRRPVAARHRKASSDIVTTLTVVMAEIRPLEKPRFAVAILSGNG